MPYEINADDIKADQNPIDLLLGEPKPVAKPTAAEKAKARKDRKLEMAKLKIAAPGERTSIYGAKFKGSREAHWKEYAGAGWVHKSELDKFQNEYYLCAQTGKNYRLGDANPTVGGEHLSKEGIASGLWAKCTHSGYYDRVENMVEAIISNEKKGLISRRYVDSGYFFECDISNNYYPRATRVNITGSDRYQHVANINIIPGMFCLCRACGDLWENKELIELIQGGRKLGRICKPCNHKNKNKGLIHPHNHAHYPAAIYAAVENWRMTGPVRKREAVKVKEDGVRLFGAELELELHKKGATECGLDRWFMAEEVMRTLGYEFVIVKEDGTLIENGKYSDPGNTMAGFEVVSAPADLAVHRTKWDLLHSMANFNLLRAWDTETCGMHVHVSKEALTTLQIGRILMFMMHDKNKRFIAKAAGRGENKYCRSYHKEKIADGIVYDGSQVRDGVEYVNATYKKDRDDEGRRQAVNITNEKTIEFRIFRGTVHPRHIIRNLEFVDAMCSFCHPGSRSFQDLRDWKEFVNFCLSNRKAWPLLVDWYESPNICLLPARNAYNDKDTRGNVRPKVIEELPGDLAIVAEDKINPAHVPIAIGRAVPQRLVRAKKAMRPEKFVIDHLNNKMIVNPKWLDMQAMNEVRPDYPPPPNDAFIRYKPDHAWEVAADEFNAAVKKFENFAPNLAPKAPLQRPADPLNFDPEAEDDRNIF